MIKFFRHIRQRLLIENRFSKYLLYAIGEIILVVIGILIALQFNNWNNERQTKSVQIRYLNEIANNLKTDLDDVRFNIGFNEKRLKACRMVIKSIDENATYSDSLDIYYGSLLYTTRSVVNYSAYETLKAKGLEIITNDSLRKTITKLYSFYYQNVIDFEIQDDHALQYQIVMPTVLSRIEVRKKEGSVTGEQLAKPTNFEELKNDVEFKNAIVMNEDLRVYMIDNYKGLEKNILECSKLINEELNKLE
ncbi:DUF6090 family protein [Jejudonia soesokkakensis]|uniref:DUF6090 family protein n=1 Tax=Jejudonia soesokkakensis TaxID=1323432 RepID=A0ABW2MS05_9FLAO